MRRALGLLSLLAAGALAGPAGAAPVHVSGATPFPNGCGVKGEQSPSSEAEPWAATDPADPSHVVVVYQQDRFPIDGGALSNLVAVSHDGGRTFPTTARFPGLSRCTGGARERTSDPWVSFGPDGTIYAASLTFDENEALGDAGLAGPTQLAVSTSTDGGATWGPPSSVIDQNIYDDREQITADRLHPGRAYVVWVRRLGALGENGLEQLSTTIDGGRTWSAPRTIYTPGPAKLPDPILLDVLPDGTLVNTFLVIDDRFAVQSAPVPFEIYAMRSTDQGATWSTPVKLGETLSTEPSDPDTGAPIRSLPIVTTAVGRGGTMYAAWNEIRSASSSVLRVVRTTDGARTWSAPATAAAPAGQAFLPAIAVAPDGRVGLSWDDTRNDRHGDKQLTTDVWFAQSADGGRTWRESHVLGPFDALSASSTGSTGVVGHFLGDYQALVPVAGGFGLAFAAAKPDATGPSDILFARAPEAAAAPLTRRLSLTVRPATVRVGRRARFTFTARRATRPVRAVLIRFAGHRLHTDRHGRARVVLALRRVRRYRAHASRRGLRSADAYVRARGAGAGAAGGFVDTD